LKKKGKSIILLGEFLDSVPELLNKNNHVPNNNFTILPIIYFFKIRDYIYSLTLAIFLKTKIKKPINFLGCDVSPLILDEINKSHPLKVVKNILRGLYIKRLVKKIDIEYFAYPFENHSWEKLLLRNLRKESPNTKIIGYQHAGIMKSLLNIYPSKFENNILPLPHKIISVGDHPKAILEKFGSYEKGLITSGCALRYEYLYNVSVLPRNTSKYILIPMTASLEESVKMFNFIQEGVNGTEYIPRYRCHPVLPFDVIKTRLGNINKGKYEVSSDSSLLDDFKKCGQVFYTVTTVCIEALMTGLPVVHIDLKEPINGDPLFECNFLRWIVKKPEDLHRILDEIKNLNDEQFLSQQKEARNYLKSYFKEVNEENLNVFL